MREKMKAVIYARYSSDNQREESIDGQIREIMEYAERNDITVVSTYIDRALSAKTDNRPEFQRMIKDSCKRLFDMIIVWKLDRFARNRYDSAHYKVILKKNDVKVVSAKETIAEGSAGILLESVLEGYAEYFSAELSEKVLRGMTENALKCKNNGSGIPLGYKVDSEQNILIDELTAPIVKEVFTLYSEGSTIQDIKRLLNSRCITNSHGKPITFNTVHRMLLNRKYIGEYKFASVVVPNGIPAIIDENLFERVQKRMEKNKKAPARHKAEDDYLLTTKLHCGKCLAYMVGESGTSKTSKVHRYYKCVTVKRKHKCDKKSVQKEWLEDKIVFGTMEMVMDDAVVAQLTQTLFDMQSQENSKIPRMKERLAELNTGINNMLNAIQQGIILDSTKERLAQLEISKKEMEIAILQEQIRKPLLTKEEIEFGIIKFRTLDISTQEGKKRLIDSFINTIYLYDDKAVLTFNYKEGTKTITFDDVQRSDLDLVGVPKLHTKNKKKVFSICHSNGLLCSIFNSSCRLYVVKRSRKRGCRPI